MLAVHSLLASKYRLLRLLGEGGMGAVWEAEDERLGSRVAVKVLHQALLMQHGIRERFLQEARVLGRVRSEHVVQVIDIGEEPDGVVFFAMEYVEGESLAKWLEREGPFSVRNRGRRSLLWCRARRGRKANRRQEFVGGRGGRSPPIRQDLRFLRCVAQHHPAAQSICIS